MKAAIQWLFRRFRPPVSDLPPRNINRQHFFLPAGYQSRVEPEYFNDFEPAAEKKIYQPDVYLLGAMMARSAGLGIIDVGCGKGAKLSKLGAGLDIIGIDFGDNISYCRENYTFGEWRECDFDSVDPLPVKEEEAGQAVVICADVIEHLRDPLNLLSKLKKCAEAGASVLISTPERTLVRGVSEMGPPRNKAHVREWSLGELRAMLQHVGLPVVYLGLTANNHLDRHMTTAFAICSFQAASIDLTEGMGGVVAPTAVTGRLRHVA